jgi:BirA family biotin operon repressor/biotin-[acetyl-CoA-carboxylase] ligase
MRSPPVLEHVRRIDSTNAELMRRPFGDEPAAPVALLADEQTAGRGRRGRAWHTPPLGALALSVMVERRVGGAPPLPPGLPLAIGVALARALARHGARVRLKWPNDLYRDAPGGPAKAGGLLVEARTQGVLQRIVVGLGLNLEPGPALDTVRAGQPVAACFAAGAAPQRVALAGDLAAAMLDAVRSVADDGLAPWIDAWRALDLLADAPVDLVAPDGTREPGIARGIDDTGALRIECPDGTLRRVIVGDVSLRPRATNP